MTRIFENAIKAVKPDGMGNSSIIPSPYDISCEDMTGLFQLALSDEPNGLWKAIVRAYLFGFVMGNRCTHRRKMKRL